jgi:hypothetical protein
VLTKVDIVVGFNAGRFGILVSALPIWDNVLGVIDDVT